MLAKFRAWYDDGSPDGYFVYWASTQITDPLADFAAGDYNLFSDFTIVEYVGDSGGASFEADVTWDGGIEEGHLIYIDSSTAMLADASAEASSTVKGIASLTSDKIYLGGICSVKIQPTTPVLTIGQKLYLSQSDPGYASPAVTYEAGDIIVEIGFSLEETILGATSCSIMFNPSAPIIVDDLIT